MEQRLSKRSIESRFAINNPFFDRKRQQWQKSWVR